MDKAKIRELSIIANKVRKNALTAVYTPGSGHPGGSLSIADALTYLYFDVMNVDAKNPKNPDRDRFVLSKGHTAPALYAVLAEKGFFPKEDLVTFRHNGSYLQGHPDMKGVPGVDMSTGSLGLGFSTACGMALAAKVQGRELPQFPQTTAVGALGLYISDERITEFQPMNINFSIISPLEKRIRKKAEKNLAIANRSLEIIDELVAKGI